MNNGQWPIHYGYMQFSTEVSSRAQLVTDMKDKSFGVLGYKYSATTNWATAKPVTAPMSDFYNLEVKSVNENGSYKYNYDAYLSDDDKSLKEWEEGNYSFFAYHPYTDKNTTTGITLSTETTTNTPTLTYTYGWLNPKGNESWYKTGFNTNAIVDKEIVPISVDVVKLYDPTVPVFDVMTAEAIDVNGTGSGTVGLNFKHRMFALEVLANNYNETTAGKDAAAYMSSVVLTLNGLQHRTMTIPLSMQGDEDAPDYGGNAPGSRSFLITNPEDGHIRIPAFNERTDDGRGEGVPTSISLLGSTNGGYLMLIPQTAGLSGSLHWAELVNFPGTVSTGFSSSIEFKAGRLYQLYINFVGSGITIALIEAGAWDIHDVEHKFE